MLRELCFKASQNWFPSSRTITGALEALQGRASLSGDEHLVYVRVAGGDSGQIYLDLADKEGRAVEVTASGWKVITNPPVRFRRPKTLLPIPTPTRGGSVMALQPLVNIDNPDEFRLLVSVLLSHLSPTASYPVVILEGPQGTAKSTTERMIRSIIDPSSPPLMGEPRSEQDLVIAARNSWVLALNNLSQIKQWLSNALCRLATGGGFRTRQLYTNDGEMIFDVRRPILLNGIGAVANQSDLLDRAILLAQPPIADNRRKTEEDIWREFDRVQPSVLGALLDVLVVVQREVAKIDETNLTRMADFHRRSIAAAKPIGWTPGDFRRAYNDNRKAADRNALEASPIAEVLIQFMNDKQHWEGTSAELLTKLNSLLDLTDRPPRWPRTAEGLSSELTRITPNLKAEGVEATKLPRTAKKRGWDIRKV